jgi:lysozyme family protein
MKAFFLALSIIFQIEGGWTGIDGGTNYGIKASTLARANTLKIVQTKSIRKLTRREAALIYYRMYWLVSGANKYPYPVDLVMFDAAVHMGPAEAKKILQTTMKKCSSSSSSSSARQVATQYVIERYKRLRALSRFPKYKRGWRKRMQIIAGHVVGNGRTKK